MGIVSEYKDFNVLSENGKARFTLTELLGNWLRIGTEGAWFATIDMMT